MKTLLLVDDEVCITESMKELLEDGSFHIITANNGSTALQILQTMRVDCVVSDIKMPVMDGLTFMQKTREQGFITPFIFYSGHACEKLEKVTRDLGAIGLLTKPEFERLEKIIHSVIRQQAPALSEFTDHL